MVLFFDLPPPAKCSSVGGAAGPIQLVCGSICLEIAYLSLRSFYFLPRQLQQRFRSTWWLCSKWIHAPSLCFSANFVTCLWVYSKGQITLDLLSSWSKGQRLSAALVDLQLMKLREVRWPSQEDIQGLTYLLGQRGSKSWTKNRQGHTGTTDQKVRKRNATADRPDKEGRPFVSKNM